MANPICPNCQRQMVVAQPQFCPFCSYQFGTPLQAPVPVIDLDANPYAEIPPARPGTRPPPIPMLDRPSPTSALVLNRQIGPRFQTNLARSVGITLGMVALAGAVVFIGAQNVIHPNQSADAWLSNLLTGTDGRLIYFQFYGTFVSILITLVPMAVVIAYWFSLRRLFQAWAPWVWLQTSVLSASFLLAAMVMAGALIQNDAKAWTFLTTYPKTIVLLVLAGLVCSGVGIGFGYFFARWPIERMRALHSNVWYDLALTWLSGLLGIAVQYMLYGLAAHGARPFASVLWWVPVAALVITTYACGAALRPALKGAPQP